MHLKLFIWSTPFQFFYKFIILQDSSATLPIFNFFFFYFTVRAQWCNTPMYLVPYFMQTEYLDVKILSYWYITSYKKTQISHSTQVMFFFNHNFGTSFYDCDLCCPDRRRVTANTLISFKNQKSVNFNQKKSFKSQS